MLVLLSEEVNIHLFIAVLVEKPAIDPCHSNCSTSFVIMHKSFQGLKVTANHLPSELWRDASVFRPETFCEQFSNSGQGKKTLDAFLSFLPLNMAYFFFHGKLMFVERYLRHL